MIIATPDQIFARNLQQITIKTQTQHLLAKVVRRIEVAIDRGDRCLIAQLQSERDLLLKQL
jgi:hypothetical protein